MSILRPCMLFVALVVSACASSNSSDNSGYGAYPERTRATIREVVDGADVAVLGEPDPYYLRYNDNWYYGWRACARIAPQDRPAFFLLRGDRVITWVMADGREDSLATARVEQYCSALLEEDRAGV